MKKILESKIFDILASLICLVFIIGFAVILTLNFTPLYDMTAESFGVVEASGVPFEDIKENYKILIDYNNLWGPDTLNMPDFPMSETGRIHFEEVKVIFGLFEIIFFASAPLALAVIIYKFIKKQKSFFLISGVSTVLIPSVLGVLVALNWQWVFVKFHEIAFNNDYWIFDWRTDPVILILPNQFFMICAIMILSIVILLSLALILIYLYFKKKDKHNI